MFSDVVLPNLGFGMEEGRLIAWRKKQGDPVKKGEALVDIESDKATVELEAVVDGVLAEILIGADTLAPVGSVLARIQTEGTFAASPAPTPAQESTQVAAQLNDSKGDADAIRATPLAQRVAEAHGIDLAGVSGSGRGGKVMRGDLAPVISPVIRIGRPLAAPAVRKWARDLQLDLNTVTGSGTDGHITRADVQSVLDKQSGASPVPSMTAPLPIPVITQTQSVPSTPVIASAPAPTGSTEDRREVPLSNMRQTIARRLVQSMQEAPHFYVTAELDFTPALRRLSKEIGINALMLHLTILSLKSVPEMNATFENSHLYQYSHVHLSMAVALPNGLMSPVLHRADDFSLSGLAERARDLISRARENRLKPDELGGGTFTVSNLGVVKQVERFTAILNPPQVGILAIGALRERPFVIDGGLHIRQTAHLTLSADHRVADGMVAAKFLEAFDTHLHAF